MSANVPVFWRGYFQCYGNFYWWWWWYIRWYIRWYCGGGNSSNDIIQVGHNITRARTTFTFIIIKVCYDQSIRIHVVVYR